MTLSTEVSLVHDLQCICEAVNPPVLTFVGNALRLTPSN